MIRHKMQSFKSHTGMTLVEVTVASIIFSIIMLALVTAMRTFGQSYDRLQQITDLAAERREVDRFLRQALRNTLPQPEYFEGSPQAMRWVAPLDRVGSAGGLQHLSIERTGDQLLVRFAPVDRFADKEDEPQWDVAVEPVALLDNLSNFKASYRKSPDAEWADSSESDESDAEIPWAVKLEIVVQQEVWPPIIVRLDHYGVRF